jgi:mRNA interferase MazF
VGYYKDYELWNIVKGEIERSDHKPPHFNEGEVWWVSVGVNVGYEIDGKGVRFARPVLILKKYSRFTFLGIPMSSKVKSNNKYYFRVKFRDRINSIVLSQIRVFDSKRLLNIHDFISSKKLSKISKLVIISLR